jgi:hypothetical protein
LTEAPARSFAHRKWAKPSTMFVATYENGTTAYFVVEEKVDPSEEYRVLPVALDRQQQGQLPSGTIKTVKRVR